MTEHQLREALVRSLRNLDPDSELVKSFWSALVYRRENAAVDERRPGQRGLQRALERALALAERTPERVSNVPQTPPPEPQLLLDLAKAAETLPDSVIRLAITRAHRHGRRLDTESDVEGLLKTALAKYALLAESGLYPGP